MYSDIRLLSENYSCFQKSSQKQHLPEMQVRLTMLLITHFGNEQIGNQFSENQKEIVSNQRFCYTPYESRVLCFFLNELYKKSCDKMKFRFTSISLGQEEKEKVLTVSDTME